MADITLFSIGGVQGTITVNDIAVELPYGTISDITEAIAEFAGNFSTITVGAIPQITGVTVNDFTNPVDYIVSDDGINFVTYTVTVTILPNTENDIITFELPVLEAKGIVNLANNTVELQVTEGVDLSAVEVAFEVSDNATSSFATGSIQDITNSLPFTVTSESGDAANYLITALTAPDHADSSYTVYKMVLLRLPFLEDTAGNMGMLSQITLEVMYELEPCFQIGATVEPYDINRVGKEVYYDVYKRSIIADIVSIAILTQQALITVAGSKQTEEHIEPTTKFVKEGVAGSVEVVFEQLSIKDSAVLALDAKSLINKLQEDAHRKMQKLGCSYYIEECEDDKYVGFIASGRALWHH